MAARRKTARRTAKKGAKRSAARKPAKKKSGAGQPAKAAKPKAAAAPAIEAMAQKIVRTMTQTAPGKIPFRELYAENATSQECGPMPPAVGLAAIQAKAAGYESQVREQSWKAKNVWAKGQSVAIEWVGKIVFKNGNALDLKEIAVHDVRDGKIVAERYYYDPSAFAAAAGGGASAPTPSASSGSSTSSRSSAPAAIASAYDDDDDEEEDEDDSDETSPIDPLDL
jgi:ketosteroid isomerase-like protein